MFDPPRPAEGRIARTQVPAPAEQTSDFPAFTKDKTYTKLVLENIRHLSKYCSNYIHFD